ncbi:hypothetical protein BDZ91DRAFT_736930, partial [Kalaharituber pfeilii]
ISVSSSKYTTTELVFLPSSISSAFRLNHLILTVLPSVLFPDSSHFLTFPKS